MSPKKTCWPNTYRFSFETQAEVQECASAFFFVEGQKIIGGQEDENNPEIPSASPVI